MADDGAAPPRRIVLLVGPPRVGKTTVVQKVIASLKVRCGGFYTQADQKEYRTDFRLVTVKGRHRSISSRPLVRQFEIESLVGFDLGALEETADQALHGALASCKILIIDQIGTYECQSQRFRDLVTLALDSGRIVLATATFSDHAFLRAIKDRSDVQVVAVTMANRSTLPAAIAATLKALVRAMRHGSAGAGATLSREAAAGGET